MPVMPQKNGNAPNNGNKNSGWGRWSKTLSFWLIILMVPVALLQLSNGRGDTAAAIQYSQFDRELQRGNVAHLTIQGGRYVVGEFKTKVAVEGTSGRQVEKFSTQLPVANSDAEVARMRAQGVSIDAANE